MSFEAYINEMIRGGYWSEKTLEPLKCIHCDSKNLEDTDHIMEECGTPCVTEYIRVCKDCGKKIGHWSYGNWQL